MTRTNVSIFLFNGFSDWEISYLTPEPQKSQKIDLQYFSIDGKPIQSMGGMNIMPDYSIKQIDAKQVSVLILPGGTAWENDTISGIDQLIEDLHNQNKTIAAICAATTYLAQKSYLDHIKHTSSALPYLQYAAKNYAGAENYQDELAVSDKNIITANGIAPIEFAREIFKAEEL